MEDTTMKKTYINPEMEIVKIATQQMLAGSSFDIDPTVEVTDEGSLLSRGYDFDDEEEW